MADVSPTIYGLIQLFGQAIYLLGLCWGIAFALMQREEYPAVSHRMTLGFVLLLLDFIVGAFLMHIVARLLGGGAIPMVFTITSLFRTPVRLLGLGLIATSAFLDRNRHTDSNEPAIRPRLIDENNPYASS